MRNLISTKRLCTICQVIGLFYAGCTAVDIMFTDFVLSYNNPLLRMFFSLFKLELSTSWYEGMMTTGFFNYLAPAPDNIVDLAVLLIISAYAFPSFFTLGLFIATIISMRFAPWAALISAYYFAFQSINNLINIVRRYIYVCFGTITQFFNYPTKTVYPKLSDIDYSSLLYEIGIILLSTTAAVLLIVYFVRSVDDKNALKMNQRVENTVQE